MDGLLYSLENLIHHAERKLFLFLGTVYRRVLVASVEHVKMIIWKYIFQKKYFDQDIDEFPIRMQPSSQGFSLVNSWK